MSSPDNKEWFQEFATALVIDRNSDENQLIHIAEIKNEEIIELESESKFYIFIFLMCFHHHIISLISI